MKEFSGALLVLLINCHMVLGSIIPATDSLATSQPMYFSSTESSYLYRAKIDAYTFHLSGIMVIKKLDTHSYRCAFTTETGFKLFDLAIDGEKAKVMYVMKEMNNPFFLKLIKEDILLMLQQKPNPADLMKSKTMALFVAADTFDCSIAKNIHYVKVGNEILRIQKTNKEHIAVEILFEERNAHSKSNLITITHVNVPVQVHLSAFYNVLEGQE